MISLNDICETNKDFKDTKGPVVNYKFKNVGLI
jgi:hypothetical protein